MVGSVIDEANAANTWATNIEAENQRKADRLLTQIGDTLGAADTESHYRQLVSGLKQFGLPVADYELRPDGPGWEAMRDLALGKIGKAMAQKTVRANLAAQQASLYTPYAGTMSSGGKPNALTTPATSAPPAPITPAFDFSTLPTQPGTTTPQVNVGTGQQEAIPQTGTPPPSIDQTSSELSVPSAPAGVENPVTKAAGIGEQNYPELAVKPISPPYMIKPPSRMAAPPPEPEKESQVIVYAPKVPGLQGFVHHFPPGYKKEADTSDDKRPNSIKEAEYWQPKLKEEFGVEPPIGQVLSIMDWRKQGIPFRIVNGVYTPTTDFVAGTKAAERSERVNIAHQRADQSATTASEKNFDAWANDMTAGGAKNSRSNLRHMFVQEKKGATLQLDPTSGMLTVTAKPGEPKDIQALRIKQDDLFNEYKDKGLDEKPSLTQTEYIQKALNNGVNFGVSGGKLVPVRGDYSPGSKADLAYKQLSVAQDRAKSLETTAKEKDLQSFIKRARNEGSTDSDTNLQSMQAAINNGGKVVVDPETGGITIEDAWKGTKAANMAEQVRVADEKLGLQRDRLDLAKKTQLERQELLMQKFEQTKYAQSLDYQSRLAMSKAIAAGDAKMYPRISAGYTAMAHLQKLDETARNEPELTNQVIGWISSKSTWQAVKDELAVALANKDQYKKSTGRSEQFIKIMQGLASLDAELDRTYFQGQGNLAEESRKRLDPLVMGLRNSPNAETFINGINCLKGYVNEIINTALPSDFARNPEIAKAHAESIPRIEKFRQEQRGLYENAVHNFNNAVSRGTPPGRNVVVMPSPSQGISKINVPLFSQDDPNIKNTIDSQLKDGTLSKGQAIHVKLKDGSVHEVILP
jgi:hypothetical protein